MKTKAIYSIVVFLLVFGCNVPNTQHPIDYDDSTYIRSARVILNELDTCAFQQVLMNEIKSFIDTYGDYGTVISIIAEKKEKDCFLFMTTGYYYDTRFLIGYQEINGKMVAYYYSFVDENMTLFEFITLLDTKDKKELLYENGCLENLIDKSKLKRDFPTNFLNENTENVIYNNYDPIGRRYIIHPDSLELVFEGPY